MIDWSILGINETKDEEIITNAYRQILSVTNPEDDAEGFMRLRQAYEDAIAYARSEIEKVEFDNTPVGIWLQKADEVYNNFKMRNSVEVWKELLSDDVCIMLDTKIEVRDKFLEYVMSHWYFPRKIWVLFDEIFDFTGSEEELKEIFPKEFIEYAVIDGIKEETQLNFELFNMDLDVDYEEFIRRYYRFLNIEKSAESEEVEKALEGLYEFGPIHPYIEVKRSNYLFRQNKPDEARVIIDEIYKQYPNDVYIIGMRAESSYFDKNYEEAMEYYTKVMEIEPEHYYANIGYADCLMNLGRYEEAKDKYLELYKKYKNSVYISDALDKVNAVLIGDYEKKYMENPEDESAKIELCWSYLQNDKIDELYNLASTINQEKNAIDYHVLMGRCYLFRDEYEKAIEHTIKHIEIINNTIDDGTEENKKIINTLGTTYAFLGELYLHNKEYDKAETELHKSIELNPESTRPLEVLNTLYLRQKEFGKCVKVSQRILELDDKMLSAYNIIGVSFYELGMYGEAYENFDKFIELYPYRLEPYLYKVKIMLYYEAYDRAYELIEYLKNDLKASDLNSCMLDFIEVKYKIEMLQKEEYNEETIGKYEEYKATIKNIIDKYQEEETDIFEVDDVYGEYANCCISLYTHYEDGDDRRELEEVIDYIKKGLEHNPESIGLLNELAYSYKELQMYTEAIEVYKKIAELVPEHNVINYRIAYCYRWLGDADNEIEYYKRQIQVNKEVGYYLVFGVRLRELDRMDEAREVLMQASELYPDNPDVYNEIGLIYLIQDKYVSAINYLKKSVEYGCKIGEGDAYQNLARAYRKVREYDKATECYLARYEELKNIGSIEAICYTYRLESRQKESAELYSKHNWEEDDIDNEVAKLNWIAECNIDRSAFKTAQKYYFKAIDLINSNNEYDEAINEDTYEVFLKLANLYFDTDNYSEAYDIYSQIYNHDEDEFSSHELMRYAILLRRMNKLEEHNTVINNWEESEANILTSDKEDVWEMHIKTSFYLAKGDFEKAVELGLEALKYKKCSSCNYSKCTDVMYIIALALEEMERYEDAIECTKYLLSTDSSESTYSTLYMRVQEKMKNRIQ